MKILVYILLLTVSVVKTEGVASNATFGACIPGKESCSECYFTMKQLLLGRDDNILNLSTAFFPPRSNIPEFVTVTYLFDNNSSNPQIWYWSHDSSYLFFQFTTFQYLSLFFGKPAQLFSQEVTLTLDNTCATASNSSFRLLTQRLKNFIEKKSFNPSIDENYFARSEIGTEDILSPKTADYILIFYIAGFIAILLFTLILIWIYYVKTEWNSELKRLSKRIERNKYAQSKIISATITAGILLMYMYILDILATYTLQNKPAVLQSRNIDENVLPYMVLGYDSFFILIWLVCHIFNCYARISKDSTKEGNNDSANEGNNDSAKDGNNKYAFLAISIVSPVLVFVVHVPYIAIAYLNDVSHATSMFIYYTVVAFVLFGTLDLSHGAYVGLLLKKQGEHVHRRTACGITGMIGLTTLTLLLIGMITAALVTVPISKAFTDTSNRLLGFYQTALVLIGAYLFYRNVFKKKTTLESEVDKRDKHIKSEGDDDHWQTLSKHQKLEKVYSHVLDILADYKFKTSGSASKSPTSNNTENCNSNSASAAQSQTQNPTQPGDLTVADPSLTQPEKTQVQTEIHHADDHTDDNKSHPKENEDERTPLLKLRNE